MLHKEFHGRDFTARGGMFESLQFWITLPAPHESAAPAYQGSADAQSPVVDLKDGAGRVRVIAGAFDRHVGPARTSPPIEVWDLRPNAGKRSDLAPPRVRT